MSNVSIGITAMELFAYNPFRILGLPVNASHAEISGTYEMLLKMADSGDIGSYTTPFDFDSLPPFSRSGQTVKTAHAKLASNGYRCFAYADSVFSASLNIDDIMLNLRGITCYDCFLRCYMWLIINDRNMEEHELWIKLARYIDKMILSSPEEWTKYFDHRFPDEMIDDNLSVYKSFYSTFCEIILLPLKEMVRGSMKCATAVDILRCAKINVDEKFEYIDIPQANKPAPGEPEPKLKIAQRYEESAVSESNSFAETNAAPLDASVLMDEPEETAPAQGGYEDEGFETDGGNVLDAFDGFDDFDLAPTASQQPAPEPAPAPAPAPAPRPAPAPAADTSQGGFKGRSRAERRAEKEAEAAAAAASSRLEKKPTKTELVAPVKEPLKLDNETASASPVVPERPAAKPQPQQPAAPRQRRSFKAAAGDTAQTSAASTSTGQFVNPFNKQDDRPDPTKLEDKPTAVRKASFSAVVEEAARKEAEAAAAMYAEEEEEDGDIRNALIDLLKSSSGRGETMKSVDTSHVVSAKEMAGPSHTVANMDTIDMKEYDAKRLASAANAERRMTREEKYRNIKIDDMLSGQAQGKNYGITAIDQYKKNKAEQKQARKSLFLAMGFVSLVIIVFVVFFFLGF